MHLGLVVVGDVLPATNEMDTSFREDLIGVGTTTHFDPWGGA